MQAECIYPAFDNQTATHYVPGLVPDFDETNDKLKGLTIPGSNKYVFRYPGHEFVAPASVQTEVPKAALASQSAEPAKTDKRRNAMTPERKAQLAKSLAAGRAAKKARLEAAAA